MSFPDLHIRALTVGQECARLGARPGTVSLITGLSSRDISGLLFPGAMSAPRGRRPESLNWYFRTTVASRMQACVVASQYARLRKHGFTPAESLIASYKHYVGLCPTPRLIGFDRAFDLASQFDGIWGMESRSLELRPCQACWCEVLAAIGSIGIFDCPFCRLIKQHPAPLPAAPGEAADRLPRPSSEVAELHIRRLLRARECVGYGARVRTIQLLTGLTFYTITEHFFDGRAPKPRGRPAHSSGWYELANVAHRVEACVFAGHFKRLTERGFEPVEALLGAYGHYRGIFDSTRRVPFDRAFELAAHLSGHWLSGTPCIATYRCKRCGCDCLTRVGRDRVLECPFCSLWGQGRARRFMKDAFPSREAQATHGGAPT